MCSKLGKQTPFSVHHYATQQQHITPMQHTPVRNEAALGSEHGQRLLICGLCMVHVAKQELALTKSTEHITVGLDAEGTIEKGALCVIRR